MAELSEGEIAELRKIFESCDLNGDGFIDREEFHSLLQELDGDASREECLLDFVRIRQLGHASAAIHCSYVSGAHPAPVTHDPSGV
jgi:hypothetical protein